MENDSEISVGHWCITNLPVTANDFSYIVAPAKERVAFDYGDDWEDLLYPARYMSIGPSKDYCRRDKERIVAELNKGFRDPQQLMDTVVDTKGFREWASKFLGW